MLCSRAFLVIFLSVVSSHSAQARDGSHVVLQGLNKVTAHVSELKGKLGEELNFGKLSLKAKACWSAPKDKRPEHAALLDITEYRDNDVPENIFSGWMFASSPGLSALEHPVYDIKVLNCE